MADANIGISEISATTEDKVSRLVQSFLIQESVLVPLVADYSSLAVKGASAVKVPRGGDFAVLDKSENTTTVKQDSNTFAADEIALNKHKYVKFYVEDSGELEATVNIANDSLMRAVKRVALQLDLDIIAQLKLASASAPDHLIKYIDTVSNVIARGDILAARELLVKQNINPRECTIAVSPEKEAELLNISDFIDASKFGSSEPISNGVIGKIYGMNVIIHNGLTAEETLVWHKSAVGYAMQMAPRVQSAYDLDEIAQKYLVDTKYGVKVLDLGVRNVEISAT